MSVIFIFSISLTFAQHPVVLASVSRLAETRGHAKIGPTHLVFAARLVIADDTRVDPDGRRGRKSRGWNGSLISDSADSSGSSSRLPLGDGNIRLGLDISVNVHLLHRKRRADNLTIFGRLGRLEDLLTSKVLGSSQH